MNSKLKRSLPIIAGSVVGVGIIATVLVFVLRSCGGNDDTDKFDEFVEKSTSALDDLGAEEAHNNYYNMLVSGVYKSNLDVFEDGYYCEVNEADYETYLESTPQELDVSDNDLNGIFVFLKAEDANNVMLVQVFSFDDSDDVDDVLANLGEDQSYLASEFSEYQDACRFYSDIKDDYCGLACEVDMYGSQMNTYNLGQSDDNLLITVSVLTTDSDSDIVSVMDDYLDAVDCENPHDELGSGSASTSDSAADSAASEGSNGGAEHEG